MSASKQYFGLGFSFPPLARAFAAKTWYVTNDASRKERLYCKCRELISGDRAEVLALELSKGNKC